MTTKMTIAQTLLSITIVFTLSTTSNAANLCKGEKETVCAQTNSCNWIKAYKRKDGVTIKAYCRTKPTKKIKSKTSTTLKKKADEKQPVTTKTTKKTSDSSKKTTSSNN